MVPGTSYVFVICWPLMVPLLGVDGLPLPVLEVSLSVLSRLSFVNGSVAVDEGHWFHAR
jgi:hypothetical protein